MTEICSEGATGENGGSFSLSLFMCEKGSFLFIRTNCFPTRKKG
jgi:hypothetical protein